MFVIILLRNAIILKNIFDEMGAFYRRFLKLNF